MFQKNIIKGNQKWISVGRLENSNLDEQRILAYGMQEMGKMDMWKFWERKTEGAGYATQPGGASNGPRGAVTSGVGGGDDHRDSDVETGIGCQHSGGDLRCEAEIVGRECGDEIVGREWRDAQQPVEI